MPDLETATSPQKLRRIAIDPVTRVEGHGKVTILLDEANKIHQVRLHIVEVRGFEKFIEGRPYWEVPVTVQRLCGICPVSHHLAAAKAMDIIAGFGPLPSTAEKLRRLMHYGQILQSHALHFFYLAAPDLLLGFDSDFTRRNIYRRAGRLSRTGQAGRPDAQIRPGDHPPYLRQAHPRNGRHPRRHEQDAHRRKSAISFARTPIKSSNGPKARCGWSKSCIRPIRASTTISPKSTRT